MHGALECELHLEVEMPGEYLEIYWVTNGCNVHTGTDFFFLGWGALGNWEACKRCVYFWHMTN